MYSTFILLYKNSRTPVYTLNWFGQTISIVWFTESRFQSHNKELVPSALCLAISCKRKINLVKLCSWGRLPSSWSELLSHAQVALCLSGCQSPMQQGTGIKAMAARQSNLVSHRKVRTLELSPSHPFTSLLLPLFFSSLSPSPPPPPSPPYPPLISSLLYTHVHNCN